MQKRCFFFISVFSFLLLPLLGISRENKIALDPNFSVKSIGSSVLILECPVDSLSIAVVAQLPDSVFQPSSGEFIYGDYTARDIWIRMRFQETKSETSVRFYLGLKRLFSCEVYTEGHLYPSFELGEKIRPSGNSQWVYPTFQQQFEAGKEQLLTIKVEGKGNYLLFPIRLYSESAWNRFLIGEHFASGWFYGAIILILASNLFVVVRYRNRSILFFFFFILLVGAVQLFRDGYLLTFWLSDHPNLYKGLISNLIFLAQLSNLVFVYDFFRLPKNHVGLTFVFRAVFAFVGLAVVLAWLPSFTNAVLRLNGLAVLGSTLLVIFTGYITKTKGEGDDISQWFGKFYTYSYLIFFIGVILTVGAVQGILRHEFFDSWALKIAFLLEVLILSISLLLVLEKRRRKELVDMQLQMAEVEQNRAKLEENIVRSELKVLVSQMKPHFIFNSLNSIQHYVMQEDKKNAHLYISRFSRLMRKNLEFSSKPLISLADEIEALELYFDLETRRLNKPIQLKKIYSLQQSLQELTIPPFLLQPLIENAFWHGFNHPQIKTGEVELELKETHGLLEVWVRDNGVGLLATGYQKSGHTSMSQNITKTRLELFEKRYHYQSAFSIEDRSQSGQNGTEVHFLLPILSL